MYDSFITFDIKIDYDVFKSFIIQEDELSYILKNYDNILDNEVIEYASSIGAYFDKISYDLSIKFKDTDSSILFKLSYINYERNS